MVCGIYAWFKAVAHGVVCFKCFLTILRLADGYEVASVDFSMSVCV